MTSAIAPASIFDLDGRLRFEPEPHRYALDGRELMGVTQAIGLALAGTLGEEHWTEEARLRGQYVHEAILLHSQDDLDELTLHPLVPPFFFPPPPVPGGHPRGGPPPPTPTLYHQK